MGAECDTKSAEVGRSLCAAGEQDPTAAAMPQAMSRMMTTAAAMRVRGDASSVEARAGSEESAVRTCLRSSAAEGAFAGLPDGRSARRDSSLRWAALVLPFVWRPRAERSSVRAGLWRGERPPSGLRRAPEASRRASVRGERRPEGRSPRASSPERCRSERPVPPPSPKREREDAEAAPRRVRLELRSLFRG
ncbi:hypothetical protein D1643_02525 [Enterorhabdus sp. P55]|nr:hypothetical protein [Enterorhabdus sp. P55]